MTPLQAIRAYCLDCCYGSAHEVKMCTIPHCELYPFRFGHNPNIRLSEEARKRKADSLLKNVHALNDSGIKRDSAIDSPSACLNKNCAMHNGEIEVNSYE